MKRILRITEEEELKRKASLLKRIPLFSDINPSSFDLLATSSETLTYLPGQTLFRQGDAGHDAYVIVSGVAEIITEGPEGVISIATLGENQIVGEIATLIDVPRTATVVAMEGLTMLVVPKKTFFHLVENVPTFALEVMCELARRVSHTTVKVREFYDDTETAQSTD
jgi:CRP-like cAMP-binding protein